MLGRNQMIARAMIDEHRRATVSDVIHRRSILEALRDFLLGPAEKLRHQIAARIECQVAWRAARDNRPDVEFSGPSINPVSAAR